jgi:hypothetical protein
MPFWNLLIIDGNPVDLSHLEPFEFNVIPAGGTVAAMVAVHFNDHCFTEKFDPVRHDVALTINHVAAHEVRAFDPLRYELSKQLPAIIRGLNGQRIFSTRHGNLVRLTLQDGRVYPVFFDLRPVRRNRIALFVVSAFVWDQPEKPATTGGMNFNVAVAKVMRGERPKFPQR